LLAAAVVLVVITGQALRVETVHLTLLFLPMAVKAVLVAEVAAVAALEVMAAEPEVLVLVLRAVETLLVEALPDIPVTGDMLVHPASSGEPLEVV